MPGRPTHQGGSVQYEDTVGVDGDSGVSILAFRNDAEAQLATADLSHVRVSADLTGRVNVNANLQVGDADAAAGNPVPVTTTPGDTYVDAAAADVHEPAVNTAAVVTLAAGGGGVRHFITGVAWSYDAAPTAGSLTITDGGATVFKVDITNAGPGFFDWCPPMRCTANSAVVATLAAAGAAVSGIVSLKGKFTV